MVFVASALAYEASRGAGAQCDCIRDCLWVRSPLEEMKYGIEAK